ncbi:DUF1131 family protein [Roseibium denhamense]|uniref:DUF1131 family protein n=1 Tax=Roseibium denhamense TaxID=76305 RepID=A0ABY1N6M7_9HYPH|nr:DUF1131 family protein [Roseibium denhamense]MTI06080.1 DUF1131 family protein [Roseibium denhamense]SMP01356.1 Protein of unknown function [Roseibium denhamense]
MRLKYLAFSLLTAAIASACSPSADLERSPASAQLARTSNVTLVHITEDQVGGITNDTQYGQKAIESALPGFTTEGIQTAVEDNTEWALAAFNTDGFQVLQVFKGNDGKVRTVHGVTHHLQGPNGERIGMTFAEIGSARANCRVGRNLWRGMAICQSQGHPNVELVYAIPGYQGPFDRLPVAQELFDAELQRILWTPKS